jgi:hypothetical protein
MISKHISIRNGLNSPGNGPLASALTVLDVFLVRVDNVEADVNIEVHRLVHGVSVEEAELVHAFAVCYEVELVLRLGLGAVHLVPSRPLNLHNPKYLDSFFPQKKKSSANITSLATL